MDDRRYQYTVVQYQRLEAEIARLQAALLKCATIPHMGQYTGSQVNAAIEESKPWSEANDG
jgi:hypothetical protein